MKYKITKVYPKCFLCRNTITNIPYIKAKYRDCFYDMGIFKSYMSFKKIYICEECIKGLSKTIN